MTCESFSVVRVWGQVVVCLALLFAFLEYQFATSAADVEGLPDLREQLRATGDLQKRLEEKAQRLEALLVRAEVAQQAQGDTLAITSSVEPGSPAAGFSHQNAEPPEDDPAVSPGLGHGSVVGAPEREPVAAPKLSRSSVVPTPKHKPTAAPDSAALRPAINEAARLAIKGNPDLTIVEAWPKPHWSHVLSKTSHDHPTSVIRKEGLWECALTMLMQVAFQDACAVGSVFIDIGMNVGWFSALAAANQQMVVAFEPNPTPRSFMEKTVALNSWGDRVRLVDGGVSDDGAELFVNAGAVQWGLLSAGRVREAGSTQVKSYRLDDIVQDGSEVCVLKVDCQGCESEAFASGARLLGRGGISFVLLEFDFAHIVASTRALDSLRKFSSSPWSCIMVPVALDCRGADLEQPQDRIWDFFAGSVLEDCRSDLVAASSPQAPKGYYLDIWLLKPEALDMLKAKPHFAAAEQRRKDAELSTCVYSGGMSDLGVCDLSCSPFTSLDAAKQACDARPSCTRIMDWDTIFELRGEYAESTGGGQYKSYTKGNCSRPS